MINSKTLANLVHQKKDEISHYFSTIKKDNLPFYSSVDLRYSGYKAAVIDTNLFPAGFNNICLDDVKVNLNTLKKEILSTFPNTKKIGIIMESHTRNQYYLLNLYHLYHFIKQAGFDVQIFSFLPDLDQNGHKIILSNNKELTVFPFLSNSEHNIHLFVLNNDLTNGIPQTLIDCKVPIVPSFKAGWHSRLKSSHFHSLTHEIRSFCDLFNFDPWLFNCEFTQLDNININNAEDREKLAIETDHLLKKIQIHYDSYSIKDIPFIFLKADAGTYGMGVHPISHPDDILNLNRKSRNKLNKGKGSQSISKYILQEGVYTRNIINKSSAEPCIYQIKDKYLGAFFRSHQGKTDKDSLNSVGMEFTKICLPDQSCFNSKENYCNDEEFFLFRTLSKLASHACQEECFLYEKQDQKNVILT